MTRGTHHRSRGSDVDRVVLSCRTHVGHLFDLADVDVEVLGL